MSAMNRVIRYACLLVSGEACLLDGKNFIVSKTKSGKITSYIPSLPYTALDQKGIG
jgi:hypothetical protein